MYVGVCVDVYVGVCVYVGKCVSVCGCLLIYDNNYYLFNDALNTFLLSVKLASDSEISTLRRYSDKICLPNLC